MLHDTRLIAESERRKVEHPRDSAEPKGETNVWPREGTQEAMPPARRILRLGEVAARESRLLGGTENRKPGRAEGRATGGWPEGRSIGGDASQRLPKGSSEGGARWEPCESNCRRQLRRSETIDHREKDCRRQPEGCSEAKSTGNERVNIP